MILMVCLSAVSEISAFPSPSVLEQTASGRGHRVSEQPTPARQTLQVNLPLILPLGQYKATTDLPATPNPTCVVLLQIN
jgi:hypothetical protein